MLLWFIGHIKNGGFLTLIHTGCQVARLYFSNLIEINHYIKNYVGLYQSSMI